MTTTRQPRQFLAVWNDDGTSVKGATFEESLFVDGSFWKNELTSIAPDGFGEFGTLFSNQLQIQHDTLITEKTSLTTELDEAKKTIELLKKELPFDPRIIDASSFYDRLTKDELLSLFNSDDPQIVAIGKAIATYKANDWPVVFDSIETQQMLGYLMLVGLLTEKRMAELTADATSIEAYRAN